ncbi:CCA tRNA nucleotidyltransferase [Micropruina sp.]|uniref:CCA tRNA nucleotidyltransferase n=1 Tax=Micropruina sp. TaxID=2737536 RepID=UPI0039E6362A
MPELTTVQRDALSRLRTGSPAVRRLSELFAGAGHELYLVGGPVRDSLLGRPVHDLDFTTGARPDEIESILRRLSSAVWDIGRAFGTIGCAVTEPGPDGEPVRLVIEVTTFRSDAYEPDSRKPAVVFGDHLGGDLVRRDFTVNAMALDMATGELLDPFKGADDLVHQVLMTPSTPELSFSDDPLRMLRAARFVAQLGFSPAPGVVQAMTDMAERIAIVSAERVRDELVKTIMSPQPRLGLNLLVATGLAGYVLPELPALRMERDEHNRHKDVYEHTLTVLDQTIDLEHRLGGPDLIARLAALLHDIGKPRTRRFEPGGKVSFHHHDVVGAKLATKRMQALKFPAEQIKAVAKLVELHLRFHGYADSDWTDSAVRRYVRDAGDQLERLHVLTRSDCTTRNARKAARLRTAYEQLEWRIDELAAQEELDAMRPDLDGTQIMAILGIGPGRDVGRAYKYLLEKRIDEGPLGEAAAADALRAWWAEQG